ncbi:hypothetical protein [Streptomyces adelaidensis]|uniref:hypothetical protein n=1 Tax=Streptomyces adelaidensis TaxID=2796465 RepID=UPI0019034D09|nr:hypothetical protein [Streptomyces adelaidensis]
MTEQNRHVTPADLAAGAATRRCGAPLVAAAAPACLAPAAGVDDTPPAVAYDRTRWESEVLSGGTYVPSAERLVALVLAHFAGVGGQLPEDGVQRSDRLMALTGLSREKAQMALKGLQRAGLLWRPPGEGQGRPKTHLARPITLTVPARREEPPHTGEPR